MTLGWIAAALLAPLLLAACSDSEPSMAEYVEEIDAVFQQGLAEYEVLVNGPEGLVLIVGQGPHLGFDDQGAQLTDFTPQDLHVVLSRVAEIQDAAIATAAEIEPPEPLAELHALYFRTLPIAALADRAATAADWEELSATPEMAAYRDALEADNQVCAQFQVKLDSIADSGAFVDTPWMPTQLADLADYALACDALPADPQAVYRP